MTLVNGGLPTTDSPPPDKEESDGEFLTWLINQYGGWDTGWRSLEDVPKEVIEEAGKDIDNWISNIARNMDGQA